MNDAAETLTAPRSRIPPGQIDAIRLAPRTKVQIFWNVIWSALIGYGAWYAAERGEMELSLFLWVGFVGFNLALLYYLGCIGASLRSGIPIPQTLIDRHGVADIGLFAFKFDAWSGLSDMVVLEDWNDSYSYYLVAFAKGQQVPERKKEKKCAAKMNLSLPGFRETSSDTKEIYGEYCCFINAWRRHLLEDGPLPSPTSLVGVAGRVDVAALSRAELDAAWRAICARY